MVVSVYLPLLCALGLAGLSGPVARRLPPALAARTLTAALVVIAASTLWSACLLCLLRLSEVPTIARDGHLAGGLIASHSPVPELVSEIAALALLSSAAFTTAVALGRWRAGRRLRSLAGACDGAGDVVVLPVADAIAVALPGRDARIVVSAGMLQSLDARGRAVLLAHERSHILHRHDRFSALAVLAGAVNPILRRVGRDVDFALERWADEDAARTVGDRGAVARALATAALLPRPVRSPAGALAFHEDRVVERVTALRRHRPRRRTDLLVAGALPAAACMLAIGDATAAVLRLLATAHG